MIRDTIGTINSRIAGQLTTDAVQVAGMAVPFYDQQEKATMLRLADEPKRLTLDDGVMWQSAHLTDGNSVTNTQTFGSFTDHYYEVRFVLMGVSKAKSGKDVALRALDGVGYVVIDRVEDDTLTVLNRYWRVKAGPDKNYDPDLYAFAIAYHIEGVCDEDFAELPDEQDLAALPVLLAEPETVVIVLPGSGATLPAINLPVVEIAQTVWNIGGAETRKTLYMGGLRLIEGVHYTINLPLLTLLSPPSPPLIPGDDLVLT